MSVLVTMRVKVHDFEGTERAVAQYGDAMWLMEFDSHEAFEKSGGDFEEDFIALIDPASDWDDAVWKFSLQKE
jgi:hypothetical protein